MKSRFITLLGVFAVIALSCSGPAKRDSLPKEYAVAESLISSRPDSALEILSRCDTTKCSGYELATWRILHTWAEYNSYEPNISETRLNCAADYFLRSRDKGRKALVHYLKAVVVECNGTMGKAEVTDELRKGCKEIDGYSDHSLASLLYMRYGVEMNDRKWYDSALEAYQRAYQEAVEAEMYITQVTTLINISHIYLFLGDKDRNYDEAIDYALKAVDTAEMYNLQDSYARAMSALSSCYSRDGDFENALECAKKSVQMSEQLYRCGKRKEKVRHVALADAYRKVGNADSALFYACLDTCSQMSPITRAGATQLLYIVYRDLLHESDSVMKYMSSYNRQKEALVSAQENETVLKNEIELEQAESKSHLRKVTVTMVSAIIALLTAALIVFALMRRHIGRKDKKLKEKEMSLEIQNREIERQSAKIREKEERLKDSNEKLAEKTGQLGEALIEKNALFSELREKPRHISEEEGREIVSAVDRAYDGYCLELLQKHPELTESNLRLLALVRLGFATGEIAVMEGISPSSVTKAKQRLNKKVGGE